MSFLKILISKATELIKKDKYGKTMNYKQI